MKQAPGCGFTSLAARRAAPTTPEKAISRLQLHWAEGAVTKVTDAHFNAQLQQQIFAKKNLHAERGKASDALKRVRETLTAAEQQKLIVIGQFANLEKERDIWIVTSTGPGFSGFSAYLDAATGDLIFLWIIPEG